MNISTNASINTYADSDYYNHYNIKNSDDPNKTDSTNRPSSPEECQTCKNRKYVDGSDEANVSFKSAAHVSKKDLKVTDGIKAREDHVDMQV